MPLSLAIATWLDGWVRHRREIARAALAHVSVSSLASSPTTIWAIELWFSSFSSAIDASAPAACSCAVEPP